MNTLRTSRRHALQAGLATLAATAAGCASLTGEPPRVTLVGLSSLPGEGLEWRLLAKLRVQNPSGREITYDGVSLAFDLRGRAFASGVAPLAGTLAAYSDAVLEVPVAVSGFTVASQVLDWLRELQREGADGALPKELPYTMRGRLGGVLGGQRFESSGTVALPGR